MSVSVPIELEIRGEIPYRTIPAFTKRLLAAGFRHHSSTRRTSVMSFGATHGGGSGWKSAREPEEVDIRCRITNGKAEVVAKIGVTDAHNRIEIGQPVTLKELINFARMFGHMGFFTKVGSKVTENYQRKRTIVSIVHSPSKITYVEIEKMSTREQEAADLQELTILAKDLGLTPFPSRKAFLELCERLTKQDDWEFRGSDADIKRLQADIKKARSDKK